MGQLNFFKWALNNKIIDHILKNYNEIEKDMNFVQKKSKENNKRHELSLSASRGLLKVNKTILISFD